MARTLDLRRSSRETYGNIVLGVVLFAFGVRFLIYGHLPWEWVPETVESGRDVRLVFGQLLMLPVGLMVAYIGMMRLLTPEQVELRAKGIFLHNRLLVPWNAIRKISKKRERLRFYHANWPSTDLADVFTVTFANAEIPQIESATQHRAVRLLLATSHFVIDSRTSWVSGGRIEEVMRLNAQENGVDLPAAVEL